MSNVFLSAEQQSWQASFAGFAQQHVAPHAAAFDAEQAISEEVVAELVRHRYIGSHVSEEYGGLGLDPISYGLLHFELGQACSSVRSLLTVHDMVAEVLLRLGTANQRNQWLPRLSSGEILCAFALTEPHAGSDARGITTTAIAADTGFEISGTKKWISFGQLADVFLVLAHVGEDGPIGAFLVDRDTPGLTISPMEGLLGMRASMLAELDFSNCAVPAEARIGSSELTSGYATAAGLNLGRYTVAWGSVGIATAALALSLRHSEEREQFGVPIGDHQLIQRLLADMATDTQAARLLCLEAGVLMDRRDPGAIQSVLLAKYHASRTASRVADSAVQIHGALGLSGSRPVERLFRDARVMEIIEGSNEIQQISIARNARRHHRSAGQDGDG